LTELVTISSPRIASLVAAALAALLLVAAPASGQGTLKVWLLKGEQLAPVDRPGATATDAIEALLNGPTPAERKAGFRTYVPQSASLNSVTVANGLATVDMTLPFALGGDPASLTARLTQLVKTVVGREGATKVKLLLDGGVPLGMFPGISTAQPLTLKYLETPNVLPPKAPPKPVGPPVAGLQATQDQLAGLGFMLGPDADGKDGSATQAAVLAFQKWVGLTPDGVLGPMTRARLSTTARPEPITRAPGKRAEVLLDRQVALAIVDNKVVRVIPVSTGKPSTPTPPGDFRVYAKYPRWWSTPFREWLLWAVPFNGGIAFHEFPEVPPYAASHGCVRQFAATAKWMFDFSYVGMPVKVIASSR
jgi:L,D-transpeptidase catalytic domain/Sporulation and spore germination/Putative peptidoglycan binding domain